MIGVGFGLLVQTAVLAFSYGSLSSKVGMLVERNAKIDQIAEKVARLEHIEESVAWVGKIVRECPTCNHWEQVAERHER